MPIDRTPALRISLVPRTLANLVLFAAVLGFSTLGAIAIGETHTGHGLLCGVSYFFMTAILLGTLLFVPFAPAFAVQLGRPWVWVSVCAVIAVTDQLHFRTAERHDDPLTSSLALELPARALLQGRNPYSVHLFHNAPISPGPGWILLLSPLTVPGWTGMLAMLAVAGAGLCLWQRSRVSAGAFCLLLLCGPLFESQAANGQDLYVISLCCVMLALLLEASATRGKAVVLLAMLAGFVATARLPFLVILMVLGLGIYRRHRRAGMLYLLVMPAVALALDGGFALWASHAGDRFQPMHIFGRGSAGTGYGAQMAVVVLLVAAMAWVLLRMGSDAADWMLGTWFVLTALFLPEAMKEFSQTHHDLRWEGSTYATFALPLLIAVLALRSRILSGTGAVTQQMER